MTCMCGATDCPSCGPAQGYDVVRVWRNGRYQWVNPEDLDDDATPDEDALPKCSSEDDSEAGEDCHSHAD